MAAVVEKLLLGSQTTLLSTGLNSLANNALAISSAFDNTIGQTGDGYVFADFEFAQSGAWGGTVTANTGLSIWFIQSQDGTNYEDGDGSTTPARSPDVVIPLRNVSTAQRVIRKHVPIPPGLFKALLKNDGTGQSMNATGNTLKIRPYTIEGV